MYVLSTKEQIVRGKKLLVALLKTRERAIKNQAKETYSIKQKRHKINPEQSNGDYSFLCPKTVLFSGGHCCSTFNLKMVKNLIFWGILDEHKGLVVLGDVVGNYRAIHSATINSVNAFYPFKIFNGCHLRFPRKGNAMQLKHK